MMTGSALLNIYIENIKHETVIDRFVKIRYNMHIITLKILLIYFTV